MVPAPEQLSQTLHQLTPKSMVRLWLGHIFHTCVLLCTNESYIEERSVCTPWLLELSHPSTKGLRVALLGIGGQKLAARVYPALALPAALLCPSGLHSPCPASVSVVPISRYMLKEKLGRYFECVSSLLSCLRHIQCMSATTDCLFGVLQWTIHITAISWPFPHPILLLLSAVFAACSEDCVLLSVL